VVVVQTENGCVTAVDAVRQVGFNGALGVNLVAFDSPVAPIPAAPSGLGDLSALIAAVNAITEQDIETTANQGAFGWSLKAKVVVGP
jgi:hypothetical protein